MPMLFLSPSTQDYNIYYDGSGSEEYYMNLIADKMEPWLKASGITYGRNDPEGTVGNSVRMSNAGDYLLHLALHSNAAGSANYGRQTGSDIYYYPSSVNGKRFAEIIEKNIKKIYPDPSRVRALATEKLYELNNTKAPAVLAEIAYHDNASDAEWIKDNTESIAKQLALSVTEYFGVPLADPAGYERKGRVATQGGRLNIREAPDMNSVIVGQIPNGAEVVIKGREGDWYLVGYKQLGGYSYARYIIPA